MRACCVYRLRRPLLVCLLVTAASAIWSDAADRYAVVELFTSQGWNSCPPADAALAQLASSTAADERVIALEWDVDYWDYLGWPDPYGSRDASLRQRSYAAAMRSRSVYTPQMVVNGRRVISATHRSERVAAEVADVYGRSSDRDIEVEVSAQRRVADGLQVDYRLRGVPADVVLTVVVAEDGLRNYVPRGENAGRTLEHVNVVRGQASALLRRGVAEHVGSLDVSFPADVDLQRSTVVALVHSAASRWVLATTWVAANE